MPVITAADVQSPPALSAPMSPQTVQLPIDVEKEFDRALAAVQLGACANFGTPHRSYDIYSKNPARLKSVVALSKTCLTTVQNAVRNGTISDVPALTLSLRGIPFTDSQGRDNVADVTSDIVIKIAEVTATQMSLDYHTPGLRGASIVKKPFTSLELAAVTMRDGREPMPELLPNRNIPIDSSTAYMMTAADVVMHQGRYTALGKTLAETVADSRTRYTAVDDQKIAQLCMMNSDNTTLQDCQRAAARNTAEMIVNGLARPYDASLYSAERIAATAP